MKLTIVCVGMMALSLVIQPANCPAQDESPQLYILKARASQIDSRASEHSEIDFVFEKNGVIQDSQVASVNTSVTSQGRLVIWLMGYDAKLFERINGYGLHAIQVHYARNWFNLLCRPKPKNSQSRGNVRLEAATGQDVSDEIDIPFADSIIERSRQFLLWLDKENPQGNWRQFLTPDGSAVLWDKVTLAGSSHGSTTAARLAKHLRVDRVVMLCGPRDQDQDWQSLPSATPENRFFGFSHVLDSGWTGKHYCRSWELLGLHQMGPAVEVEQDQPPYNHTRRLISNADVGGSAQAAHSAVTPGKSSPKNAEGQFLYEPVWRYLFNQPVDEVGTAYLKDPNCTVQTDGPG